MKEKWITAGIIMAMASGASAALTKSHFNMGSMNTSSSVTQSVTVAVGDVIVMATGTNKKPSKNVITYSSTSGVTFIPVNSWTTEATPDPASWMSYAVITTAGTYDFISTASETPTAINSLYHLSSTTGDPIEFLDGDEQVLTDHLTSTVASVTNTLSWVASPNYGDIAVVAVTAQKRSLITGGFTALPVDNGNSAQRQMGSTILNGDSMFEVISSMTNNDPNPNRGAFLAVAFGEVTGSTPSNTDKYNTWLSGYSVGNLTNLTDDADGDLLDNLAEYAFGGAPDDATNRGNIPAMAQVSIGGTNYLEYVYFERDDATSRGLSTTLEAGTDLISPDWTTAGIVSGGSGLSAIPGYMAVTNRISTDDDLVRYLDHKNVFTP